MDKNAAQTGIKAYITSLITMLLLAGCGGSDADSSQPILSSFNLTSLSASTISPKQLSFSWTSASDSENVTYSVCEKDMDLLHSCKALTGEQETLTADVGIVSLANAITSEYFILARDLNGNVAASNELSLDGVSITSMIGYFKASNTGEEDDFGFDIAISGDSSIIAISAPEEDSDAQGVYNNLSELTHTDTATDSGAIYLFKNTNNRWEQSAYIKSSNSDAYDFFGYSLALSRDGTHLAVGAPYENSDAQGVFTDGSETLSTDTAYASGAVYLFENTGDSWVQVAYIKASNSEWFDEFGHKVALDGTGTTLAVSAVGEDNSVPGVLDDGSEMTENSTELNSGAVYVFTKSGDTWSQSHYIKASNPGSADAFGYGLAISDSGTTLVIGSRSEDNAATGVFDEEVVSDSGTALNSGAAYVFKNKNGNWVQDAYIKSSNTESGDYFGGVVALSGDGNILAISAIGEDNGATGVYTDGSEHTDTGIKPDSGAIYMFSDNSGNWQQTHYLKASDASSSDYFGSSIALNEDGSVLSVGATGEDSGNKGLPTSEDPNYEVSPESNSGAVYLFKYQSESWIQSTRIKASNSGIGDFFGESVALDKLGESLVVSALNEDNSATGIISDGSESADIGSASNSGAVYLY